MTLADHLCDEGLTVRSCLDAIIRSAVSRQLLITIGLTSGVPYTIMIRGPFARAGIALVPSASSRTAPRNSMRRNEESNTRTRDTHGKVDTVLSGLYSFFANGLSNEIVE
jgi:hypothetical protein